MSAVTHIGEGRQANLMPQAPSRSQLEFLASLLRRSGETSIPEGLDVTDRAAVSRAIERLRAEQPVDDPVAFVTARIAP
jgi:NADP-dependent 3-hydroxy acid dehydrogenase YdfG